MSELAVQRDGGRAPYELRPRRLMVVVLVLAALGALLHLGQVHVVARVRAAEPSFGRLSSDPDPNGIGVASQALNAMVKSDVLARYGIEFLHLPTPDTYPPSLEHFEQGVGWVLEQQAAGRRVFVH